LPIAISPTTTSYQIVRTLRSDLTLHDHIFFSASDV
jgi:hypothetical protein